MKITHNEVIHVANLARIDLDEKDVNLFAKQIGMILEYVETLDSIGTEGVKATYHAISLNNAFRDDCETKSLENNAALLNAPEKEDGAFVVPKII